jgi:hypothetical protein
VAAIVIWRLCGEDIGVAAAAKSKAMAARLKALMKKRPGALALFESAASAGASAAGVAKKKRNRNIGKARSPALALSAISSGGLAKAKLKAKRIWRRMRLAEGGESQKQRGGYESASARCRRNGGGRKWRRHGGISLGMALAASAERRK